MANYRVCFRLPTFVVQLSFEAAERDISYEEMLCHTASVCFARMAGICDA